MTKIYQEHYKLLIGFITIWLVIGMIRGVVTAVPTWKESKQTTDETYHRFLELMLPQPECALPCWWGFMPGEASLQDWVSFVRVNNFDALWGLEPLQISRTGDANGHIQVDFDLAPDRRVDLNLAFGARRSVITGFEVSLSDIDVVSNGLDASEFSLSLPSLFDQMQTTPELYLHPNEYVSHLKLLLIFPEEGVAAAYRFNVMIDGQTLDNNVIELCSTPERTFSIDLWLQDPNREFSLIGGYTSLMASEGGYVPFGDYFDITPEAFAEHFVEREDECLFIRR